MITYFKNFVHTLIVCCLVIGITYITTVQAQNRDDKENEMSVSVLDANAFKTVKRVVVFMSGPEEHSVKLLEDALAIELRKLKWEVVSRAEVQTAVAKDFVDWANQPDSAQTKSERKNDDAAIAALVRADAYFTGTALFGRRQNVKEQDNVSEKIVVTGMSFQIVNVEQRKTIFETVLNYAYGISEIYVAQDVREKALAPYLKK